MSDKRKLSPYKTITEEVTTYAYNPEVSKSRLGENERLITMDNESRVRLKDKPLNTKVSIL